MQEPDRIGRYQVIRLLGSGAFATVWLARDDALDAEVAVKVLAENWSHRLDVHERFLQEAQILRRCDSDRVVQVYDIGELEDRRPYFVMAYADRGTLADQLAEHTLDVPSALGYARDAALGVAALHEIGVIHRDVKPSNVLLRTGRGGGERVLIADLGMAKATARASGFTLAAGTPGYMSPEQMLGEGLSVRADVYGLGALLHQLLTGRVPEPATGTVRPMTGVPEDLTPLLRRALAADPDERQPDAAHFAAELTALLAGRTSRSAALTEPVGAEQPVATRTSAGADTALAAATSPTQEAALASGPSAQRSPATGPGRRRRRAALAGAAVLLAAATTTGGVLVGRGQQHVTVHDSTGTLAVTVPAAWGAQVQDSRWNLGPYGRPDVLAASLAVADDVGRWRDPRSPEPGLFVGVAPGVAANSVLAAARHPTCAAPVARTATSGALIGRALRFTGCQGGVAAYDEVALTAPNGSYTVYLQVKAADAGQLDRTSDILASLVVGNIPTG